MHFVSRRSLKPSKNVEFGGSSRCRITTNGFGEPQPNGRTSSRRQFAIDPKRPARCLHSGRSAEFAFYAPWFHEAAVGDLPLPARTGRRSSWRNGGVGPMRGRSPLPDESELSTTHAPQVILHRPLEMGETDAQRRDQSSCSEPLASSGVHGLGFRPVPAAILSTRHGRPPGAESRARRRCRGGLPLKPAAHERAGQEQDSYLAHN